MPSVDGQLAAWLKSESLKTIATPGGVAWPTDRSAAIELLSPILSRTDAFNEAARMAALVGGPLVKDRILVKGRRRDLLFKCISLTGNRKGYSSTPKNVFVIGVTENDNGSTHLVVLRSLA